MGPNERLATKLVEARRSHRQWRVDELGAVPATSDDAYDVQDRVARMLGWFASGHARHWKVGAAGPGAAPSATPLPAEGVAASPARFAGRRFHGIGIEAEVAFRFASVPRTGVALEDVVRAVGEIVVTIEIVDARIVDAAGAPAMLKLADAQMHGALVVGTGIPWRPVDWERQRVVVKRDGVVVHDARGGHALRDPASLLPWFVDHVDARLGGVCAGDLVTAGTWIGILPAAAGDAIDVVFDGIGAASVSFDAI
jgi:2-keto-4-pentenoate hydratase